MYIYSIHPHTCFELIGRSETWFQLKRGFRNFHCSSSTRCVPRPLGGRAHLASELPEVRRYPTGDQVQVDSRAGSYKKNEKRTRKIHCFSKAEHFHHHSTEDGRQEGMTGMICMTWDLNVLMLATKNYRQLQISAPSPQVNFEVE